MIAGEFTEEDTDLVLRMMSEARLSDNEPQLRAGHFRIKDHYKHRLGSFLADLLGKAHVREAFLANERLLEEARAWVETAVPEVDGGLNKTWAALVLLLRDTPHFKDVRLPADVRRNVQATKNKKASVSFAPVVVCVGVVSFTIGLSLPAGRRLWRAWHAGSHWLYADNPEAHVYEQI
eukprot:jgi/Mesvir1/1014/Mv17548-RA.1